MRKLLIGAMMASLFMMSSDADAFSLLGKKSKTTSDASSSKSKSSTNLKKSASAPNLGTKKVGLFSKLTGKASKQKTLNATIYSQQMGRYFEAPVAAICIQSGGLATFFSDEIKNDFYVKNSERNTPDVNAKSSIQNAIKAFNSIYNYMRKILQNEGLLTKTDADKIIGQLRDALLALVGTGEEQSKPSKFWKYFGNHIRYSLIVMRNNFNMLLYPKEYWNVGALLFSANDGTRGANGEKYATNYHVGSLNYTDPIAKIDENSPILALRNGLTALVDELVEAEVGSEEVRKLRKQDRNERLFQASSRAQQKVNEIRDFVSEQDLSKKKTTVLRGSASTSNLRKGRNAPIDDYDYTYNDLSGSDEAIDEDAYDNAWIDQHNRVDYVDEDYVDEDYNDYMRTRGSRK